MAERSKAEVVGISIGEGRGTKDWQTEGFGFFLCGYCLASVKKAWLKLNRISVSQALHPTLLSHPNEGMVCRPSLASQPRNFVAWIKEAYKSLLQG